MKINNIVKNLPVSVNNKYVVNKGYYDNNLPKSTMDVDCFLVNLSEFVRLTTDKLQ